MKNSLFLNVLKYGYPFFILLVMFLLQNYHADRVLQIQRNLSNQQFENLKKGMFKDNVPPNIQEHITSVAFNASTNTESLVTSLNSMQTFSQIMLFIVFFSYFGMMLERKAKKEEEEENQ